MIRANTILSNCANDLLRCANYRESIRLLLTRYYSPAGRVYAKKVPTSSAWPLTTPTRLSRGLMLRID